MGVVDAVSRALGRLVSWLYLVAVGATFYEVFMRYLFNAPTIWAHELTIMLVAVAFLVGGAYVMQERAHIRITVLYDLLPPAARRAVDFLNLLLALAFLAGLAWATWKPALLALRRWETTGSAWDPPLPALIKPMIGIAALLMLAQASVHLVRLWRDRAGTR